MEEIKISEINVLTPLSVTYTDGSVEVVFLDVKTGNAYWSNGTGVIPVSKPRLDSINDFLIAETTKYNTFVVPKQVDEARLKAQEIFSKGFNGQI